MGFFNSKCMSTARLDGKTAIVTGANTGIGKETVKDFFKRGARVILACRNIDNATEAAKDIEKQCSGVDNLGELHVMKLDLSSLASVRICAKTVLESEQNINLLINNAGVMMCPQSKTEDGLEMQFGTNHIGHFLLTILLLPKICQSPSARIVNVSSVGHKFGRMDFTDLNWRRRDYSASGAYQQSKLANVLFTKELARRLKEAEIAAVTVYALHPGVIATELGRHLRTLNIYYSAFAFMWRTFARPFVKTPEQGAQTTIFCAVDEKCTRQTGLYYSDCSVANAGPNVTNTDAQRLWTESLKLVGLDDDYNPLKNVTR